MTIWFFAHPNMDVARKDWIKPLEDAVNLDIDAFWQYLGPDRKPNYSIENNESKRDFNKGIYAKYRPLRNADGSITKNEEGRVVEDNSQVKDFYAFDKVLNWEVPYECAVYKTISVIRDVHRKPSETANTVYSHFSLQCFNVILLDSLFVSDHKERVSTATVGNHVQEYSYIFYFIRQSSKPDTSLLLDLWAAK